MEIQVDFLGSDVSFLARTKTCERKRKKRKKRKKEEEKKKINKVCFQLGIKCILIS